MLFPQSFKADASHQKLCNLPVCLADIEMKSDQVGNGNIFVSAPNLPNQLWRKCLGFFDLLLEAQSQLPLVVIPRGDRPDDTEVPAGCQTIDLLS